MQLTLSQNRALALLTLALTEATDSDLFEVMAASVHPDHINRFCDGVTAFAEGETLDRPFALMQTLRGLGFAVIAFGPEDVSDPRVLLNIRESLEDVLAERGNQFIADTGFAPDDEDAPGEDPAHLLPYEGGAVAICDTTGEGPDSIVEHFATIADAEAFLGLSACIDPDKLKAGGYSIDAPLGLGSDDEAIPTAERMGFRIFYSMGNAYYSGAGNHDVLGWSKSYPNTVAAAWAALATVAP